MPAQEWIGRYIFVMRAATDKSRLALRELETASSDGLENV